MTSASASEPWTGERVAKWLQQSSGLERQLIPVSDVLFAAARLAAGERVLDVGCGTGPTTHRAAELVGSSGTVTGLDVSADMLAAAAAVAVPAGDRAPTTWVEADVTSWTPEPAAYDIAISRFGVMFFSDPDAAFANLALATRPGGRLAMAIWARRDESDLFEVPFQAALRARRAYGLADPDGVPLDGGPFSLSDTAATTALLERAGWSAVATTVHDLRFLLGGGASPDEAARAAADLGATRMALDGLDQPMLDAATAAIAETLADHVDEHGHVELGGRVIVVTARR